MSSTYWRTRRNVSLPTCFTATPSAKRPTCASFTRRPAATERAIASESSGCTPMTLTSGRTRFTYAAMPLARPAAADGDEDRVDRPGALAQDLHADRALARDHVGIVVRMHEHRVRALLQFDRVRIGIAVRIAVQHDLRARAPRSRRS
jgi:hypothetical protein